MTRPGIVRADTIDLQNQDSPSAKDHSKGQPHLTDFGDNLIGSHQASEVRHVIEERQSEEQNLQVEWGVSDDSNAEVAKQIGSHDESRTDESDAESASDDDMLDRISSSPSINDGAYPCSSPIWPERSSSLTPATAPLDSSSSSSSPFLDEPSHFPLFSAEESTIDSPASTQQSSSPYAQSPQHVPLWMTAQKNRDPQSFSTSRHPKGEYETTNEHLDGKIEQGGISSSRYISPLDPMHVEDEMNATKACYAPPLQTHHFGTADKTLSCDDNDPFKRASSPADSSESWSTLSDDEDLILDGSEMDDYDEPDDDDDGDFPFCIDERFVDSGWGGECLRESEDIDFDFVYALHTFVATVEGQANATKGDTMVLLDDSNSYWWLVRVVKDSSIGYLPAEHIETPTERLARLNKHRNVDLSAAMLGDNADRPKNPLKKAMRRRNAKMVQFAPPTYVEASDYEYSDDEDDQTNDGPLNGIGTEWQGTEQAADQQQQRSQQTTTSESASMTGNSSATQGPSSPTLDTASLEEPQGSPQLVDNTEAAPLKSRKGTPRNADSFLKDDGGETRKISLTPSILRDDSGSVRSAEIRDSSFESLEKTTSPTDKAKEEKKKKEKKQGMLSGLFKGKKKDKKDEKSKKREFVRDEDLDKATSEATRQSALPAGDPATKEREAVDRKLSLKKNKLSKAPATQATKTATPIGPNSFVAELEGSQVAYEAPTGLEDEIRSMTPQQSMSVRKVKAKKAKQRQALDDFDEHEVDDTEDLVEHDEEGAATMSFMHGTENIHIPMVYSSSEDEGEKDEDGEEAQEGSSTPPSLIEPQDHPNQKNGVLDISRDASVDEQTDNDPTPTPSKPHSPQLPAESTPVIPSLSHTPPPEEESSPESRRQDSRASTTTASHNNLSPSPASTSTTWSDAGLRAWLDGDNDIRDMLVVIHDKSDVKPVDKSHPLLAGLFVEESKTLQGLSHELDGLLGGFLKRRSNAVTAQV